MKIVKIRGGLGQARVPSGEKGERVSNFTDAGRLLNAIDDHYNKTIEQQGWDCDIDGHDTVNGKCKHCTYGA